MSCSLLSHLEVPRLVNFHGFKNPKRKIYSKMKDVSWPYVVKVGGAFTAAAGLGLAGYFVWKKHFSHRISDEGFAEASELFLPAERKILVLGLTKAGKTSLLTKLSAAVDDNNKFNSENANLKPTEGFNVTSITKNDCTYNIWEIGGSAKFRPYWSNFFQDTDVLVFIVDSAAQDQLPSAYDELRKALSDARLQKVPVLIVANKKDLPTALPLDEILKELTCDAGPRKFEGISTSCFDSCRDQLLKAIFKLCR